MAHSDFQGRREFFGIGQMRDHPMAAPAQIEWVLMHRPSSRTPTRSASAVAKSSRSRWPSGERIAPLSVGASRGDAEIRHLDGAELERANDLLAMLVGATAEDPMPSALFVGGRAWFGPVLAPHDGGFATRVEWFDASGARGTFAAGRVVAGLPECDAEWLVAWRELPATAARLGHSPRCVVVIDCATSPQRPLCAEIFDEGEPANAVDSVLRLMLHGADGRAPCRPHGMRAPGSWGAVAGRARAVRVGPTRVHG